MPGYARNMRKKTKKTKKTDDRLRVVIALTESSPLDVLWREAMKLMQDSPADLLALLVDDERWRRAASLPFTREISRISGAVAEFTPQRAEELNREGITRMQSRMQELATKAHLAVRFEVLPESDRERIRKFIGAGRNILIAHSLIRGRPIYTHLSQCDCRMLLIDAVDEK